jgi:transposase
MEGTPFLPLSEGMLIDQVQLTENGLRVAVMATHATSRCPLCVSRPRRSFIAATGESYEMFPVEVVKSSMFSRSANSSAAIRYARAGSSPSESPSLWSGCRTDDRPALQALQAVGLSTCGKGGAKLAARLGIQTSRHTILRRIMDLPGGSAASVVYLGIDDFPFDEAIASERSSWISRATAWWIYCLTVAQKPLHSGCVNNPR